LLLVEDEVSLVSPLTVTEVPEDEDEFVVIDPPSIVLLAKYEGIVGLLNL
jgi:hypothetical protein